MMQMGILLNQSYWTAHVNNLIQCRARPGRMMTQRQTDQYLRTLCVAFSDLAHDEALVTDLRTALGFIDGADHHPTPGTLGFKDFIQSYEAAEREWLMQSGIDLDSAAEIIESIRAIYPENYDNKEDAERIAGRIRTAANVCCRKETMSATAEKKLAQAGNIRGIFSGVVTVSVDAAVIAGTGVFAAHVLPAVVKSMPSYSIHSGFKAIINGTRRWF